VVTEIPKQLKHWISQHNKKVECRGEKDSADICYVTLGFVFYYKARCRSNNAAI
jgi:hypothetical protein